MAHWGGVTEKQAQRNMRQFERWGVAIPVAPMQGGRNLAVHHQIDLPALFRVLVFIGANPSNFIREFCLEKADMQQNISVYNQILEPEETIAETALHEQRATSTKSARKCGQPATLEGDIKEDILSPCIRDLQNHRTSRSKVPPCVGPSGRCLPATLADTSQDSGEYAALVEPARATSNVIALFDLLKKSDSEPTGERASRLAGAASHHGPIEREDPIRDAAKLLAHIEAHGPTKSGEAATFLGWGVVRALRAETKLLTAGGARKTAYGLLEKKS